MNVPINRREFLRSSSLVMAIAASGTFLTLPAKGGTVPTAPPQASEVELWLLQTGCQELAPDLYTYIERHLFVT
jgi:hypothetical protein